jgi:DNA-binding NtrC family response regulator
MHFADDMTDSFQLSPDLIEALKSHPWQGNVRELRNVVERALSLRDAEGYSNPDQVLSPIANRGNLENSTSPAPSASHEEVLDLPFKEAKGKLIEAFERDYLNHLLTRHKGNISRAAAEAGIDRNYIHRLVKKYGIVVQRN